jgi:hypothetical protein
MKMDRRMEARLLDSICTEVQAASIMVGPHKPWGAVLKLWPLGERSAMVAEDIHGRRYVNEEAVNHA